jgi:ABC-2 type transport system ATP-binding protein
MTNKIEERIKETKMIEVKGLSKRFDNNIALDGLDMNIEKGSIYGLVGANGAGKTTIIKHLAGVIRQDKGTIMYEGQDVWENEGLKQKIGLIPDELYFPPSYNMKNMRSLYRGVYDEWDDEKFNKMSELFKLNQKKKINSFSKGMKKQVLFCLVLATKPEYLLLDEPIDGLDPLVRKLVWRFILDDVKERQMTVVVSSHNLRDMEDVCDHIGIIAHGKMMLERKLDSLKTNLHKIQVSFGNIGAIGASIKTSPDGKPFGSDTKVFDVTKPGGELEQEPTIDETSTDPDKAKQEKTPEELANEFIDEDAGAAKFDPYKGLNILHKESRGTVDLLIINNDIEEARQIITKSNPILFDILPLSLEELFIYELGGKNNEIRELIF